MPAHSRSVASRQSSRPAPGRSSTRAGLLAVLIRLSRVGARRRDRVLADYHADTARRARAAVIAVVRAGLLVGPAPFGYRTRRYRATRADGARVWVRRLEPDPATAPIVSWMFWARVHRGMDPASIARRLNTDPRLRPPVGGSSARRRWDRQSVTAALTNPVYTGRLVWGRSSYGHPVPPERWIMSGPRRHRALVTEQRFLAAQSDSGDRATLARLLGIGVANPAPSVGDVGEGRAA